MGVVRITAGRFRGRSVQTPAGKETRPLLTRVRKSLADVLRPRLPDAWVLDLFAGSGAIALELISNGAVGAVAVEQDRTAADLIRGNARALGIDVEVRESDVFEAITRLAESGRTFDVVIVAPPYGLDLQRRTLAALDRHPSLLPGAIVAVQRDVREPAIASLERLRLSRSRTYGRTVFDFYEALH